MPEGEVAAVVGIEDLGDPAHLPAGIALAPDRIPEHQGRVQRGGRFQTEAVTRDGATIVVFDQCQPRLDDCVLGSAQPDREQRVIGLPDFIGMVGVMT
jgi:hypothetical protein